MRVNNHQGMARKLVKKLRDLGIDDEQVLAVMEQLPRHEFMPESLAHQAYDNNALPIGNGQTISQPFMVAKMTSLIMKNAPRKVLEIGTGSGYQTAVLAKLVAHVYSVERISTLQYQANRRLQRMDLHNISMRHGDGWQGWPSKAPFDAIIVTAAAAHVPEDLITQLSEDGGRLVIPVGEHTQELLLVERNGDEFQQKSEGSVRFVPLLKGDLA
ncbi:protein-L-isoaspartate and D-aspartate O-methyltransferase [Idiomarina sp. A28L]|uniref:protein-L-isoaspartate(D-aspartate) O-methyltransferase n=1 Tax=Idiomarina sp. A28L TaxID=1036674 RepID=UPI00021387E0|nr:protein-L-isoaspartate(D-aspartate) O-methyltransferase [Idiomarina sp. A28L]EGN75696.1 protein-L-isoaspartate and D-aspartate O-methyltransferase [Idiomarina sp. A28L]